jgi:hypothetical protein
MRSPGMGTALGLKPDRKGLGSSDCRRVGRTTFLRLLAPLPFIWETFGRHSKPPHMLTSWDGLRGSRDCASRRVWDYTHL